MKKLIVTLGILFLTSSAAGFIFQSNQGKVALIDLNGQISPGGSSGFSASGITPDQVRKLNDEAVNQGADAIVYEINSGGGPVVASKEIYRDIEDVDVPTVCRLRDTAASGGYLIALGCDKIVADSASLTGSIGVRSSYLEYSGLLDKLGVEYVNISEGSLKGIGDPYTNITGEERQVLQNIVDKLHEDFVSQVSETRNLTNSSRNEVASSEPFLGDKAAELGLVDEIGGRETAIETAENMTGKELNSFEIQTQPSFNLFSLLTAQLSIDNLFKSQTPVQASIN